MPKNSLGKVQEAKNFNGKAIEGEVVDKQITCQAEDWFNQLCDEMRAVKIERQTEALTSLLQMKHEHGELLVNNENFKKSAKGNGAIIEQVAQNIKTSSSDLYLCIQFYNTYADFDEFISGQDKNISWSKVKKMLSSGKEETAEKKVVLNYHLDEIINAFTAYAEENMNEEGIERALGQFKAKLFRYK